MKKGSALFITGGGGYCLIEILWRGYTHWSMFLLGGTCFLLLCFTFSRIYNYPLLLKAIIGGGIITAAEFITGLIVNIALKWNVWDYSASPFNLLGQICLPYSVLWVLLCIPIALLMKAFVKNV
ncbi:MAG: hypothetical protein IJC69_04510 [Clostridia bacterium]|nr:hypothetical protein [Clostridia bacterium]